MSDENWVPLSIRGNAVAEAYHRQTQAFVESLHARVKEAEARAERAEAERDAACRMADDNAQIVRVAADERDRAEARVREVEGALDGYDAAIRWLMGEEGDFAPPADAQTPLMREAGVMPRFWWRREFRRRLPSSASPAPSAEPGPCCVDRARRGWCYCTPSQRARRGGEKP